MIALVFDFDGTLGPDTISSLLIEQKVDPEKFWLEVAHLVKADWDPPLAYMHLLWQLAKKGKIEVSQKYLKFLGEKLVLFPGLPQAFVELKTFVKTHPELQKVRVKLEFYIISGGIEEMILGSTLARQVNGIFGSNFAYEAGKVVGIKSAISFTEKTRFLYGINKGISVKELRTNPYKINDALPHESRRIPFSQMIYIGDGPSDIPCLSAITQYAGTGIGVSSPELSFRKGYELARGRRITVGPYTANYATGSDMRKVLEETILRISLEIAVNQQKHVIQAPQIGS